MHISETEDMQSWTLTGELGVHKKTEKIERPKTAAENEEQVSDEDRALHEELTEEIVSRLLDLGRTGRRNRQLRRLLWIPGQKSRRTR